MLVTNMKKGAPGDEDPRKERDWTLQTGMVSAGKAAAQICQPHRKPSWEAHRFIVKQKITWTQAQSFSVAALLHQLPFPTLTASVFFSSQCEGHSPGPCVSQATALPLTPYPAPGAYNMIS